MKLDDDTTDNSFRKKLTLFLLRLAGDKQNNEKCQDIPPTHTEQQADFLSVGAFAVACGVFEWAGMCTQKVELSASLGKTAWCFCTDDFSSLQAA